MQVLTNPTVVIILQYINDQINTLYILNLHNVICQLYFNKVGGAGSKKRNVNAF